MRLPVIDNPPLEPIASPGPVIAAGGAVDLADRFGRRVGYLRLSLTKACSMRCTYCRPHQHDHPAEEPLLNVEEIAAIVGHLVTHHGLKKVRLTGGEPTARPELTRIIRTIAGLGAADLAMTTNGLTLPARAAEYAAAGLKRINISIDSLDRARFAAMTGVDGLERVIAGIDAALAAGMRPVKLNAVVLRDQNESELADLVRFAADRGVEMRFIELMPMGPLGETWRERYVSEAEMVRQLSGAITSWEKLPHHEESARRYRVTLSDGRVTTIGFITPMSCNFCATCNRIRIAADGGFYPCLMDKPALSLLEAIRPRFDAAQFDALLASGLAGKQEEHPAMGVGIMTHIGG